MSSTRQVQVTRCRRCGATCRRAQLRIVFWYRAYGWRTWGRVCRPCAAMVLRAATRAMSTADE